MVRWGWGSFGKLGVRFFGEEVGLGGWWVEMVLELLGFCMAFFSEDLSELRRDALVPRYYALWFSDRKGYAV